MPIKERENGVIKVLNYQMKTEKKQKGTKNKWDR